MPDDKSDIVQKIKVLEGDISAMKKKESDLKKSLFGLPSETPSNINANKWQAPPCKNCKKSFSNPLDVILSRPHGMCKECSGAIKSEMQPQIGMEMSEETQKSESLEKGFALPANDTKSRIAAINHPAATNEQHAAGLKDPHPAVRVAALNHPKTLPIHVAAGMKDPHPSVRFAALSNKHATAEHISAGLNDRDLKVKDLAQKKAKMNANSEKFAQTPFVHPPNTPEVTSVYHRSEKNVFEVLKKALPRLGGKDLPSKQMTQHALASAPGPQKVKEPEIKLPSVNEQHQRRSVFDNFMPAGRWDAKKCEKDCKCKKCIDKKESKEVIKE